MNLSSVIVSPVLTEKSVQGQSMNKYALLVEANATKIDVKTALWQLYGVHAEKVNINKRLAKYRLGKNRNPMLKRHEMRKAIVTLKKGEKLDLSKAKK